MNRFIVLALGLLLASGAARAETVVVTAARMLDVERGAYVADPQIIIINRRISSVGRRGAAVPDGARRVDLPGLTLLPGLIDMHVHLTSVAEIGGRRQLDYTDRFWTAVGVANARKTLEAGFTTVRNVGSDGFEDVGLKQAIEGGFIPGPRIVPATYALGSTGGHCDDTGMPPRYDQRQPSVFNGPEEARQKVRWVVKYGAEVIKICATGGVFSHADTNVGAQQLSAAEIRAITDEAHMQGIRVAAHAHGDAGIRAAVENGVDTIEHASLASAETIAIAAKKPVWFGMDIYNDDYILSEGEKNGVMADSLEKERQIGRKQRETFRAAHKAGVRMIFSSDAGVYPHGTNARQFATMVEWGMTPIQAIRAATINAAEALGRPGDVGAIAAGRYGDLIAVDGDPLADVRVLQNVRAVVKGGELVKAP
ncbi:MAG: amidohydrolase family protein [Sphingomonadaceae bacterium]|nr:amidohydrolase family protein [Sphingomonadaceae bacterium]